MLSKFASSCAAGVCLIPTLFGTICLRLGPGQTVCKLVPAGVTELQAFSVAL